MSVEPEFQAHLRCHYCHAVRPKAEIIFADDKPLCRDTLCRDAHYLATMPRPVPKSQSRFDHG